MNRKELERNLWCVLKTEVYDSKYLPCDRPSNSRGRNGTESLLEETFEFRHSFKNYCCIQNGAFKSKRQLNDYNNGMLRYYKKAVQKHKYNYGDEAEEHANTKCDTCSHSVPEHLNRYSDSYDHRVKKRCAMGAFSINHRRFDDLMVCEHCSVIDPRYCLVCMTYHEKVDETDEIALDLYSDKKIFYRALTIVDCSHPNLVLPFLDILIRQLL